MLLTTEKTLACLKQLVGGWHGEGRGEFPTIEAFTYRETLHFQADTERPMLAYEQQAWLLDSAGNTIKNSHWETGFFFAEDNGVVRVNNAQNGRVEILEGHLKPNADGFILELEATHLAGDDRMVGAKRRLVLAEDIVTYTVTMHTTATACQTHHLSARLMKTPAQTTRTPKDGAV